MAVCLQMTASEAPDMKLFSPCLCKGSLALVHIECLNAWRKTSNEAYFSCYECKYKYRLRRPLLSQILSNHWLVIFLMICLTILGSWLLGWVVIFSCDRVFNVDIYEFANYQLLSDDTSVPMSSKHYLARRVDECRFLTREYQRELKSFQDYYKLEFAWDYGSFLRDGTFDVESLQQLWSAYANLLTEAYLDHFSVCTLDSLMFYRAWCACNRDCSALIESVVVGALCMGLLGFLANLRRELTGLYNALFDLAGRPLAEGLMNLVTFALPVAFSLLPGRWNNIMTKLICGVIFITRSVFGWLNQMGKELAVAGEQVMPAEGPTK
jgi:hypothetical protein